MSFCLSCSIKVMYHEFSHFLSFLSISSNSIEHIIFPIHTLTRPLPFPLLLSLPFAHSLYLLHSLIHYLDTLPCQLRTADHYHYVYFYLYLFVEVDPFYLLLFSTLLYFKTQFDSVPCDTIPYDRTHHCIITDTTQYNSLQNNTIQQHTIL
jgi:hypothetical protein